MFPHFGNSSCGAKATFSIWDHNIGGNVQGSEDHMNVRIQLSGFKAHYTGDTEVMVSCGPFGPVKTDDHPEVDRVWGT